MNAEDLEKLWKEPAHWTGWSYRCKEDPRLIVPKKNPAMGWTFNSAHPKALIFIPVMAVCALLGPGLVILTEGIPFNTVHFSLSALASGVLVAAVCFYFSRNPG